MATSFLQIPYLGQNVFQPEIPVNEALDIIDASICGQLTIAMTDTNYTIKLTNSDNTATYPHEWQFGILILDGAHTASRDLILPDGYKMKYVVENNTGQDIVFKTVTGASVTITTGTSKLVYSSGIDIKGIL